jgi:hypothetical protein
MDGTLLESKNEKQTEEKKSSHVLYKKKARVVVFTSEWWGGVEEGERARMDEKLKLPFIAVREIIQNFFTRIDVVFTEGSTRNNSISLHC